MYGKTMMQKGGSTLTSTIKGTSAINTKSKPESKAKSNFNYNTELAKKQKADAAAKVAKADAAKKAAAKVASGKKVKAVVESLIRPKTPVVKKPDEKKPVVKKPDVKTPVVVKPPAKTVSQIWKEKTGTEWSEAKKQGLSDGSAKSNLALLAKLKSGSLDKDKQSPAKTEPAKMETVKATDMKIPYTGPTELAGVKSPEKKKKGGIIKTKKK
jgi:hypothetical protein